MTVYINLNVYQIGEQTVRATVTAVYEDGVDLTLEDGTALIGWHAPMYDENGNVIPLETVRRDFLPTDTASLLARIAQLEAMVTGGETGNV